MYRAPRSTYFSSLRVAAISAAAPASRAALSMYDSASGHVTVTSQHNDLPLCQGTRRHHSCSLAERQVWNSPIGSLVTGTPAEVKTNYYYYCYWLQVYSDVYVHVKLLRRRTLLTMDRSMQESSSNFVIFFCFKAVAMCNAVSPFYTGTHTEIMTTDKTHHQLTAKNQRLSYSVYAARTCINVMTILSSLQTSNYT